MLSKLLLAVVLLVGAAFVAVPQDVDGLSDAEIAEISDVFAEHGYANRTGLSCTVHPPETTTTHHSVTTLVFEDLEGGVCRYERREWSVTTTKYCTTCQVCIGVGDVKVCFPPKKICVSTSRKSSVTVTTWDEDC